MAAAALSACIAPQQEDMISIIDQKETRGEAVVKTLQVNNCSGQVELAQDLQALNQYNHIVEIITKPGASINRRAVEDEIRAYYRVPYQPSDAVCVIPVVIPAGAFYSYDIEWVEVWREGVFEVGVPDGREEGSYRLLQSMLCEVVAQRAEACNKE
jgi:hypothetical protein